MEKTTSLYEILLKYKDKKPMDLGSHVERSYPVSAVLYMMEEYRQIPKMPYSDPEYNSELTPAENIQKKLDAGEGDLAFWLNKWFNL